MSEYGQICPMCFARKSSPDRPPASAIATGIAKPRRKSDTVSCIAAMTRPPSVPNRHQTVSSPSGTAALRPTSLPEATYSTAIHSSLRRIINPTHTSFAANTMPFGTGAVSTRFQLWFFCSIYIVYEQ